MEETTGSELATAPRMQKVLSEYSIYINDLWKRLYRLTILFGVLFVAGFLNAGWIVKYFITFFDLTNVTIVVTSPYQFIDLAVDIGMFCALVITAPVALWQGYAFIRPAVSKTEFRVLLSFIPLSFILFLFGFAYGFASMYWGLQMLAQLNVSFGLKNLWDIDQFMSQLTITAVLLGILFQFPIVIYACISSGFVPRSFFVDKRRHVWFICILIVSLLPPTDGVSLVVMSAPLILMYEIMLFWSRFRKPGRSLLVEDDAAAIISIN
jgi:sec-independent protein translocase protein TatC